jgi:hypothetical protein
MKKLFNEAANPSNASRSIFGYGIVIFVVVLALLSPANLLAASLYLIRTDNNIPADIGESVDVDVFMGFFDEATIGGGFDLVFDSSELGFDSWNSAAIGDPFFQWAPDILDGILFNSAFGDFNGLFGSHLVATVSFLVLNTANIGGSTVVQLRATSGSAGPFISYNTFQPMAVEFGSLTIQLGAQPEVIFKNSFEINTIP